MSVTLSTSQGDNNQANIAFSVCFIVPCYNHGSTMSLVIQQLSVYQIPCFIVNDGSNQETEEQLNTLAQQHSWVTLITLSQNEGKGSAVMAGFRETYHKGFTHALQIDADGQHDFVDITKLIEKAKQSPNCLISGQPIYDDSVPKHRYYSRYITHFWVWLETLSFSIKDSMCGFRIYPLKPTVQLINRYNIGKRMDFDTDIMVRLYWQGVDSLFIPTKVIYPKDGISHFNAWKDNLRISWMHTRLFFGMLPRAINLLQRHRKINQKHNKQTHWSETEERKGLWGIKLILNIYKIGGRRIAKTCMIPVITYFWITGKTQRKASQQYLTQLKKYCKKSGKQIPWVADNKLTSYHHFSRFGDALLDKLACWQGDIKITDLYYPDRQSSLDRVKQNKGTLLIGSHLGDIELCRALGQLADHVIINALVFTQNAVRFNQIMQQVNPDSTVNLIPIETLSADTVIVLKQKIDAGEWVAIVGDRTSINPYHRSKSTESGNKSEENVIWADFLGKPAPFPKGPFILASVLACPVYLIWGLKPNGRFQFYMEPFADPLQLPRENRQQALQENIQRYAQRLEHYTLISPLDWFNFYNFWQLNKPQQSKVTSSSGTPHEK